tara:strand:+ start:529 stop:777 length:249 start_codon:yes stop_codon:yes gene_type:complete
MSHYVIRQGGKGRLGFIKNRDSDGLDEGDLTEIDEAEKFTEEEAHAWVEAHKGKWAPEHEVIGPIKSENEETFDSTVNRYLK